MQNNLDPNQSENICSLIWVSNARVWLVLHIPLLVMDRLKSVTFYFFHLVLSFKGSNFQSFIHELHVSSFTRPPITMNRIVQIKDKKNPCKG